MRVEEGGGTHYHHRQHLINFHRRFHKSSAHLPVLAYVTNGKGEEGGFGPISTHENRSFGSVGGGGGENEDERVNGINRKTPATRYYSEAPASSSLGGASVHLTYPCMERVLGRSASAAA